VTTVVFSGSLASTGEMWDAQAAAFAGRFDVVALDHPGHAGIPLVDVDDVGGLAAYALERIEAERFAFVGLSLGAAIGMAIALGPGRERLEKLVVACTSPRFGDPGSWRERAARVRAEGLDWLVDTILERWFTPAFGDVRRYRRMFLSTEPEAYARGCDALARWDMRGRLGRIDVPMLAIAGADDQTSPPPDLESIAGEVAGARLAVIARARHLANVERPDEFNALLADFL
jgi:3-oxoadipate enol-lactonase